MPDEHMHFWVPETEHTFMVEHKLVVVMRRERTIPFKTVAQIVYWMLSGLVAGCRRRTHRSA